MQAHFPCFLIIVSHVCILGKEDVLSDDPLECGAYGGGVGLAAGVEVGDELGAVPGRLPDGAGQLPLHHLLLIIGKKFSRQQETQRYEEKCLVVRADGDGGEIDVPHSIVCVLDGGDGGGVLPLVVDGAHAVVAQHGAHHPQEKPDGSGNLSKSCVFSKEKPNFPLRRHSDSEKMTICAAYCLRAA